MDSLNQWIRKNRLAALSYETDVQRLTNLFPLIGNVPADCLTPARIGGDARPSESFDERFDRESLPFGDEFGLHVRHQRRQNDDESGLACEALPRKPFPAQLAQTRAREDAPRGDRHQSP